MHDHVTGRYIFGYKLLVCGYWNGGKFIPVDFSLHRERGGELDRHGPSVTVPDGRLSRLKLHTGSTGRSTGSSSKRKEKKTQPR